MTYLQLAHTERHLATGVPVAKVIHGFGRADRTDKDVLARLVSLICRVLDPTATGALAVKCDVEIVDSRRLIGAFVWGQIW